MQLKYGMQNLLLSTEFVNDIHFSNGQGLSTIMEHGLEGYPVRLRVPVCVGCPLYGFSVAVFRIRIRIRKFLGHTDPNLLNRGTDPDLHHQVHIVRKILISRYCFVSLWLLYDFLSMKNDLNVPSKTNKRKHFFIIFSVTNDLKEPSKSNKQKNSTMITQKVQKGSAYRRKNYLQNYRKLNNFWHSAAGSEWFVAGGRERVSGNWQNWFPFSGLAKPHWGPTNQHRRNSEVSKERKRKATIRYTYRLYTFATFDRH